MRISEICFIKKAIIGIFAVSLLYMLPACTQKTSNNKIDSNKKTTKELKIKEIKHKAPVDFDLATELLENNAEIQFIETINWPLFKYKPDVKFRIAYWQDQIWLKFYVNEENIRAKETRVNGNVYKDSCVEFFISTKRNDTYYNFEFNCIGIPHVGYGKVGTVKSMVDPEILKLMTIKPSLGYEPFDEKTGGHQWELMVTIPKECLAYDEGLVLKGLKASANFYKCGDETSKPHYVTWNPVGTAEPDYHQPAYFGEIIFE